MLRCKAELDIEGNLKIEDKVMGPSEAVATSQQSLHGGVAVCEEYVSKIDHKAIMFDF